MALGLLRLRVQLLRTRAVASVGSLAGRLRALAAGGLDDAPPAAPALAVVGGPALPWRLPAAEDALAAEDGEEGGRRPAVRGSVEAVLDLLRENTVLAVPKRKKSHSRSRMRQLAHHKQLENIHHFYPCPGCKDGFLKLNHHLCVCKLKELGYESRKRDTAQYGSYRNPPK